MLNTRPPDNRHDSEIGQCLRPMSLTYRQLETLLEENKTAQDVTRHKIMHRRSPDHQQPFSEGVLCKE